MASTKLYRVIVVGVPDAYAVVEDALTALKCMEVTRVDRQERHFLLEGWLPVPWFGELRHLLEEASKGRATLELDQDPKDEPLVAPVLLSNPRMFRPFEYLVELFSMPGRRDFDPTVMTAVLLPAFLGFAIGDLGKGIVLAGVGFVLRRRVRTPFGDLVAALLLMGGLWTAAFGLVVYGEFFGFPLHLGALRPLIHRSADVILLLEVALVLGFVHLLVGFAVGFVYERRRAGLKMAVLRKLSWLIILVGVGVTALGLLPLGLRQSWIVGAPLIGIGVTLVGFGGGVTELLEVPALIGNLVSYLRLAALALAEGLMSAGVDAVLVERVFPYGVWGWILGLVILAVAQSFLLMLAMLMVTLQALRLHYVEFYTKFYSMEGLGKSETFDPTRTFPRRDSGP